MATVAPALQDRMEVITVPGYTVEEKIHIAQRHLIVKQLERHGLTDQQLVLPEDTLRVLSRFCLSVLPVTLSCLSVHPPVLPVCLCPSAISFFKADIHCLIVNK